MKLRTIATYALAASMAVATAPLALAQGAKQDMKDAGHETKSAAKDAGHGIAKGTKKAYHATKHGTKKAAHKVHNTFSDNKTPPPQ